MRSGRPTLDDRKVAAPIRLRQSVLDKIWSLGSLQEFAEEAILAKLEIVMADQHKKSDTTSTNQP
jgi:hypothetical protein